MSNGATAGTLIVSDLRPGIAGSYPSDLTNINGNLFFAANDGVSGVAPWVISLHSVTTGLVVAPPGAAAPVPTVFTRFLSQAATSTTRMPPTGTDTTENHVSNSAPGVVALRNRSRHPNGDVIESADAGDGWL